MPSPSTAEPAPLRVGYSIEEVTAALGISRAHLYNLLADGRLRSFKLGRRRLISPQALHELVARAERDAA